MCCPFLPQTMSYSCFPQLQELIKKKKKKRSGTMDQGTVIEKNALGLDRACFIYQAHCRPDIELRGSGKGMCLLSKREGT